MNRLFLNYFVVRLLLYATFESLPFDSEITKFVHSGSMSWSSVCIYLCRFDSYVVLSVIMAADAVTRL